MQVHVTDNIDQIELADEFSAYDIKSKESLHWIYQGSLIKYIEEVPLAIKSLIPLKYFLKHGSKPFRPIGESLFDLSFCHESADEVMTSITDKLKNFDFSTAFGDIKRYASIVAIELIRNGIVENVKSKQDKQVNLKFSESDSDIIISVTDDHGSLKSEDFISRFKNIIKTGEYERKPHGAGLGLFMVINSVSTISIEVTEGIKTEIICTINKYKRLKHFKEKETAIFFD